METKTKRSTGRPKLQKDAVEETVVMEQPKTESKKKRTIKRKEQVSRAVEYEIIKGVVLYLCYHKKVLLFMTKKMIL